MIDWLVERAGSLVEINEIAVREDETLQVFVCVYVGDLSSVQKNKSSTSSSRDEAVCMASSNILLHHLLSIILTF